MHSRAINSTTGSSAASSAAPSRLVKGSISPASAPITTTSKAKSSGRLGPEVDDSKNRGELKPIHIYKVRLVLKGGTRLILFVFDLPRLSVVIDLNYMGPQTGEEAPCWTRLETLSYSSLALLR